MREKKFIKYQCDYCKKIRKVIEIPKQSVIEIKNYKCGYCGSYLKELKIRYEVTDF